MENTRAALRYAKAILNLAKENGVENKVNEDMRLILQIISENVDLDTMLNSPIVRSSEKVSVLNKLFSNDVNEVTLKLFRLLKDNKRIDLLKTIAKKYAIIYDVDKHILEATVITAVPITAALEKQVLQKIAALTGDKANLVNVVNPEILGGFVLRVGDIEYNASISNHLNQLRKEFDNQDYISKL